MLGRPRKSRVQTRWTGSTLAVAALLAAPLQAAGQQREPSDPPPVRDPLAPPEVDGPRAPTDDWPEAPAIPGPPLRSPAPDAAPTAPSSPAPPWEPELEFRLGVFQGLGMRTRAKGYDGVGLALSADEVAQDPAPEAELAVRLTRLLGVRARVQGTWGDSDEDGQRGIPGVRPDLEYSLWTVDLDATFHLAPIGGLTPVARVGLRYFAWSAAADFSALSGPLYAPGEHTVRQELIALHAALRLSGELYADLELWGEVGGAWGPFGPEKRPASGFEAEVGLDWRLYQGLVDWSLSLGYRVFDARSTASDEESLSMFAHGVRVGLCVAY